MTASMHSTPSQSPPSLGGEDKRLSAVIIAKNEEAIIARAIKSVSFVDEVIVIDAESTDRTREVAAGAGAQVIINPWPGYGPQKNVGLAQAQGEWVLFIDADEEVTPTLAESIMKTINKPESKDFQWLRIVTVFLGKPLQHLYGHNPRLFRRASGKWTDARVHEQVVSNADITISLGDSHSAVITEPLMHHSHSNIQSYLAKMHRYTTLDAEQMMKTGKHRSGRAVAPSFVLPWRLGLKQLLKMLIYRKGILDGWAGIVWCALSSYYEFEMASKFNKLSRA